MRKKKGFDLYKSLSERFKFIDRGIYQFAIRSLIFFTVVFGIYMFIFVYFRHTGFFMNYLSIPEAFYFEFLSGLRKRDFINAVMFTAIIFIIWNRDSILFSFSINIPKRKNVTTHSVTIMVWRFIPPVKLAQSRL